MKSWRNALNDAVVTGATVGAATAVVAAIRGRRDSGSAIAPINSTSHALWGDHAASVERLTWRHTVPGYLIHTLAAIFWVAIFERLFGDAVERHGARAAIFGGGATAALAYVVDYKVVPERLTPGYEKRLSARSLVDTYAVLAIGIAAATLIRNRRR